jgi:hypothetical protein
MQVLVLEYVDKRAIESSPVATVLSDGLIFTRYHPPFQHLAYVKDDRSAKTAEFKDDGPW